MESHINNQIQFETLNKTGFFHKNLNQASPLLVFLHGAGFTANFFVDLFKQLPDEISAIAIDLPGRNQSTKPTCHCVSELADFTHDFLQNFSKKNIILCGHSLGGAIALELLLYHPDTYDRSVLMNTGAKLKVLPALLALIENNFSQYQSFASQFMLAKPQKTTDFLKKLSALMIETQQTVRADFQACNDFDFMEKISKISQPTLVLSGSEDLVTPKKYSDFLVESLQQAVHHCIDNTGHLSALEQPKKALGHIINFLDQS